MAIRKQEFYEGAALHLLVRGGMVITIRYEAPLFVINDQLVVYLKYSTRGRSPWGFTFMPEEQSLLLRKAADFAVVIGLICGADGVATVTHDAYMTIAAPRKSSLHVACYRQHGGHYEVNGPDGMLTRKIPPSAWHGLLTAKHDDETS